MSKDIAGVGIANVRMGRINAIVAHNHVLELPVSGSIRMSVCGIVRCLSSTINIGLRTRLRFLLGELRVSWSIVASGLGFARLLAGPPRMRSRIAYRSSLTHDEPILGNVLHLLLALSQLDLFQMLILGHLKLILLLGIWRECVTIVSTAHGRVDQGVLATS